jgi:hypothetical protein
MTSGLNIKASVISAIIEVSTTHPIDYLKTIVQNNKNVNYKEVLKTPYKGLTSRFVGIVPMRMLFWNSLDYFQNKGFNAYSSAIITSVIQTSIDYPIEQAKTQRIIHNKKFMDSFKGVKLRESILVHLMRNMFFAISVNSIINRDKNSFYYGALGGFCGSLITHPLDTLKTWYQSGNKNFPNHWKIKDYMAGWGYRCSVSLIGMNIGWIIYHRLKE